MEALPTSLFIYLFTVPSTNIGTLGKYEQSENKSALFILFIFHTKYSQDSNLSLK